jgi:hypothetical protein
MAIVNTKSEAMIRGARMLRTAIRSRIMVTHGFRTFNQLQL